MAGTNGVNRQWGDVALSSGAESLAATGRPAGAGLRSRRFVLVVIEADYGGRRAKMKMSRSSGDGI
jgi:hypothetical protein